MISMEEAWHTSRSFESTLNSETSRDYDMRSLDNGGGPIATASGTSGGGGEKFAPPVRLCRFSHDGRQLAVVYDTGSGGSPSEVHSYRTRVWDLASGLSKPPVASWMSFKACSLALFLLHDLASMSCRLQAKDSFFPLKEAQSARSGGGGGVWRRKGCKGFKIQASAPKNSYFRPSNMAKRTSQSQVFRNF